MKTQPSHRCSLSKNLRKGSIPAFAFAFAFSVLPFIALAQTPIMPVPAGNNVAVSATVNGNFRQTNTAYQQNSPLSLEQLGAGRLSGAGEVNAARGTADLRTASLSGFVRGGEGGGSFGRATTSEVQTFLRDTITLTADPGAPANQVIDGEVRFHVVARFYMGPNGTGYLANNASNFVELLIANRVQADPFLGTAYMDLFGRRVSGIGEFEGPVLTRYDVRSRDSSRGAITLSSGSTVLSQPQVDIHRDFVGSGNTGFLDMTYRVPFEALPGQRLFLRSETFMSTIAAPEFSVSGDFLGYYEIDLPAGYGFTSDSGVFGLQPIPEPARAAALFGAITLSLGLLRRRPRAVAIPGTSPDSRPS